jgi:gamma-glutamylcysteine synthetase
MTNNKLREITGQLSTDILFAVVFKGLVVTSMKVNDDGQYFTESHPTIFGTVSLARCNTLRSPFRFKLLQNSSIM